MTIIASVLTIGRLARRAGVNVETVRHYQRIGLIDEPGKPAEVFRTCTSATFNCITFIKRAQALRCSLDEVRGLLDIGTGHCANVRARTEEKLQRAVARIDELEALKENLNTLIDAGRDDAHCSIVESLAKPPATPR